MSGTNALSSTNALIQAGGNAPAANALNPQYLQWLQLASQHFGVAPDMLHSWMQSQSPGQGLSGATDAPWVQNLKRLVQPGIDPRALVSPQYQNTDPGLNRVGPRVGDVVGT